jgi:TrpR-related protein YerC/YecD
MKKESDHESHPLPDPIAALCDALLALRTNDECRSFLADLCTPNEVNALAERWVIARLLDGGDMSYRDISAATGASTTTVGRVARFLQQEPHEGYKLVLNRVCNNDKKSVNNNDKREQTTDRRDRG